MASSGPGTAAASAVPWIAGTIPEPVAPVSFCAKNAPIDITYPAASLFRNPTRTFAHLSSCKNYAVVFISAHGDYIGTFPAPIYEKHSYAVVQTGGGDATGCSFIVGSDELMRNLFSINLLYSFQYLLGIHADRTPTLFRDLHYSTSDHQFDSDGKVIVEIIPNKQLTFTAAEKTSHGMGMFLYDPAATIPAGSPLFRRLDDWDVFFDGDGVSIEWLLDTIPLRLGAERNYILVISSCADISKAVAFPNFKTILQTSSKYSQYSFPLAGEPTLMGHIKLIDNGSMPAIVRERTGLIPQNWRRRKTSKRVSNYFKKTLRKMRNTETIGKKGKQKRILYPGINLPYSALAKTEINRLLAATGNYPKLPNYESEVEAGRTF